MTLRKKNNVKFRSRKIGKESGVTSRQSTLKVTMVPDMRKTSHVGTLIKTIMSVVVGISKLPLVPKQSTP